jgi:prepilin-type N-terminal cleavage/methylation domain-containing protein
MHLRRKSLGFTIVELLIVIVVIGILAAIVVVAYNGITSSTKNVATISEMKQWHKLFQVYKARFNSYPDPGVPGEGNNGDIWCLGTGFPSGSCVANNPASSFAAAENTGTNIMTELKKVGTPPANTSKLVVSSSLGPFLRGNRVETVIQSVDGCPEGVSDGWYGGPTNDNRQHCYIELE